MYVQEELTQQLFLAIHTLYCRLEEMPNQFRSIGTYMARSILVEQLTQLAMVPDHLHIFVISLILVAICYMGPTWSAMFLL